MNNDQNQKCGHCNNFTQNENDFQLIPLGSCEIENSINTDFHRAECGHFEIKQGLNRNINCKGCHYELWPEFECNCIRNHTSEKDNFYISVKY